MIQRSSGKKISASSVVMMTEERMKIAKTPGPMWKSATVCVI